MPTRWIQRYRFRLTDPTLHGVVEMLAMRNIFALHPRAWDALMSEVDRRRRGEPAQDVVMWNGVYETLPSPVQAFLCNHVRIESRRAA